MKKIELRKARDFGELFNDSVSFLRLNFKSFFGILIFLAGPFVLLTGLLMGYLQFVAEKLTTSNGLSGGYKSSMNMFAGSSISTVLIFVLIFLLTSLVANASIALYFKIYDKASPDELPVQRSMIAPLLASASFRLFYNLLLLTLIFALLTLALVAVFYFLYQLRMYEIALGLALVVIFMVFTPAVVYLLTVANFIVIRDEVLITTAIIKAIGYLRGNFWWTWLLMFCALISLSMLYMVFNTPYFILTIFKGFTRQAADLTGSSSDSSLLYVLFSALSMFGSMVIISPIFTCFCIFNFYNQEERREGTSLLGRIDTLDKN